MFTKDNIEGIEFRISTSTRLKIRKVNDDTCIIDYISGKLCTDKFKTSDAIKHLNFGPWVVIQQPSKIYEYW